VSRVATRRAGQQGFTLLEILVVLVIGVLLVALVPPLLSGMSGATELRGAARQLAAGLRNARNEAVTRQREAILTLDLAQRRFAVSGDPREITLPDGLALKLYTARSELLDAATGNIRFFPDGSSTGGAITVSGPKLAYRVNVDWLTGAIAIVEQDAQP
jgi:general secretion pathway protein H